MQLTENLGKESVLGPVLICKSFHNITNFLLYYVHFYFIVFMINVDSLYYILYNVPYTIK